MTQRYVVTGRQSFQGHKPGETFEADIEPRRELRLLRGGFISLVPDPPTPPPVRRKGESNQHQRKPQPS